MIRNERIPADLLTGRSAVIAGGTGSVGRHMVRAFLDAGATVLVPSRSSRKIEALRQAMDAPPDRLVTLEGDLSDEEEAGRVRDDIIDRVGRVDAAVATLGGFVSAPSVLDAPLRDVEFAFRGYPIAHFMVARTVLPLVREGGSYTFINGPLAFDPLFTGAGLISIATAAQAMLARVVMKEAGGAVRVNELVLYTRFGWDDDESSQDGVSQDDVGRYSAYLASDLGANVRGESIHLRSLEPLAALVQSAPTGSGPS